MYVSELVDYIKSDPGYKEGMKVQLGACFSGSNGVAQAVANMLGTPVQAPKHWVDLRADDSLQPISEDKSMTEP